MYKTCTYNNANIKTSSQQLEFTYQKGTVLNILHDKPTNVLYRQDYVNKSLLNLNNKEHPTQPEVFLDESYCHVHHQADKSWNKKGGKRNVRGRQQMLVMFAAFMVHTAGRQLDAKMIAESVKVWPIIKKKDNKAISDYHGNFNADKFENLFEGLCAALEPYGSCIIHMDGASYHKRRVDSSPHKGNKKSILVEWLEAHGVQLENIHRETKVNGNSVEKRKKKVPLRLNESTSKEKQSVTPLKLSVSMSKIENAVCH